MKNIQVTIFSGDNQYIHKFHNVQSFVVSSGYYFIKEDTGLKHYYPIHMVVINEFEVTVENTENTENKFN